MASQQQQPQHDVAAQQEAAEDYQPDLKVRPLMPALALPEFRPPACLLANMAFCIGTFCRGKDIQ
jgi:hypothetical protein